MGRTGWNDRPGAPSTAATADLAAPLLPYENVSHCMRCRYGGTDYETKDAKQVARDAGAFETWMHDSTYCKAIGRLVRTNFGTGCYMARAAANGLSIKESGYAAECIMCGALFVRSHGRKRCPQCESKWGFMNSKDVMRMLAASGRTCAECGRPIPADSPLVLCQGCFDEGVARSLGDEPDGGLVGVAVCMSCGRPFARMHDELECPECLTRPLREKSYTGRRGVW